MSISCASAMVIESRIDDREQQLRVRNHSADILRDGQPRHGRFDSKRIQSHRSDHASRYLRKIATYAKVSSVPLSLVKDHYNVEFMLNGGGTGNVAPKSRRPFSSFAIERSEFAPALRMSSITGARLAARTQTKIHATMVQRKCAVSPPLPFFFLGSAGATVSSGIVI
jgi:hypothetical protein